MNKYYIDFELENYKKHVPRLYKQLERKTYEIKKKKIWEHYNLLGWKEKESPNPFSSVAIFKEFIKTKVSKDQIFLKPLLELEKPSITEIKINLEEQRQKQIAEQRQKQIIEQRQKQIIEQRQKQLEEQKQIIEQKQIAEQKQVIPFFDYKESKIESGKNSFCFIIASYNNENYIKFNLYSIIYQNYKNWRIIYVNDCSTDKTKELFSEIVKKNEIEDKVIYIQNKTNMKQAFSKYTAYQLLGNDEIGVVLDGDDWLSNNLVLTILNNFYNQKNCLMAYSGSKLFRDNRIIKHFYPVEYSKEIKEHNNYRSSGQFYFSHLRTGKGILFKQIPKSYMQMNDKWLDRVTDWADMFCIAELAGNRVEAIPELLHIYNVENSKLYENSFYNDYSSTQRKEIESHIVSLPKLTLVEKLIEKEDKIHIVMCCWKRFYLLEEILESLNQQLINKQICLHILNNNPEAKIKLDENINNYVEKFEKLEIYVSNFNNEFVSFLRFYYVKDLIKKNEINYVIFIDDDQIFNKGWVRSLYKLREPNSYIGWYCKSWDKDRIDYWNDSTLSYLDVYGNMNKDVEIDYIGPGGSIIDATMFKEESELWNLPENKEEVYKMDDIWLSYIVKKKNWKLKRSFLPEEGKYKKNYSVQNIALSTKVSNEKRSFHSSLIRS